MIEHGYCQLLHYKYMYHIWYYMFIDNLSVAPIALYHICYTPAVERQNHSLKKYMEMCVLYHIWYKMQWRVKNLIFCWLCIIVTKKRNNTANLMPTSLSLNYWCLMSRHVSGFTCPSSGGTTRTQNWCLQMHKIVTNSASV
jgi:hypothetical protein